MGSTIQRLSGGALSAGANLPFYSPEQGTDRKASLSDLAEYLQGVLTSQSDMTAAYLSPLTGATFTISPPVAGGNVFLRLTPAGTIAFFTLNLPVEPVDRQEILVKSTQIITALSVSGGAATVSGAPTTLAAANAFFRMRYDQISNVWDRIG